jgi:hypothetical protein
MIMRIQKTGISFEKESSPGSPAFLKLIFLFTYNNENKRFLRRDCKANQF